MSKPYREESERLNNRSGQRGLSFLLCRCQSCRVQLPKTQAKSAVNPLSLHLDPEQSFDFRSSAIYCFRVLFFDAKMGKKTIVFCSSAILWLAVLWQGVLKDLIFISLGVGRRVQKIEEFPYSCKRIYSPLLESCEDIWLDEEGRRLYAACSTVANRQGWGPGSVTLILYSISTCASRLLFGFDRKAEAMRSTSPLEISTITCLS